MRAAGGQLGSYSWSGKLMWIAWQFTRSRPMRALHKGKKKRKKKALKVASPSRFVRILTRCRGQQWFSVSETSQPRASCLCLTHFRNPSAAPPSVGSHSPSPVSLFPMSFNVTASRGIREIVNTQWGALPFLTWAQGCQVSSLLDQAHHQASQRLL